MKRQLTVAILALGALLGRVPVAYAQPLSGPINVTNLPLSSCPVGTFNANGTDSSFDTLAFQCAVNLLPASGGEIYVPAGVYRLNATISVTDKPVAFRGEGKQISRIVWDGVSVDGLSFISNSTGLNYTLAVRSLSLLKRGANGGAAIRGQWIADNGGHNAHGVVTTTIHDVHTGTCGSDSEGNWNGCSGVSWPDGNVHWGFGIQLIRTTAAKITAFDIQGGGIAGIQLAGMTAAEEATVPFDNDLHKSISVQIRDGVITKATRGIETRDKVEGLHVSSVSIREAHWGMELKATTAIPGGLGSAVTNNYILARYRGIDMSLTHGMAVSNNLIERFESTEFKGIRVWNGRDNRFTGNTVKSGVAGGEGIVLDGTSGENLIEGNTTVNMSTGISLAAGSAIWNFVTGNVLRGTAPQIAPGSWNWVHDNH
jgi:hypothetical protein